MRPLNDWTDRKYYINGALAHLVPFGAPSALCGKDAPEMHGTGCMDEIEKAQRLDLCLECEKAARPRVLGSAVDPAVATWAEALNQPIPREKGI